MNNRNREEFEKWISQDMQGAPLERENGAYLAPCLNRIWRTWQARQFEIDSANAENERLRYALKNLLDDTQHKEHEDCESGPCPVREAREALAAAPTPPAQEDDVNTFTPNPVVAHETGNINDKQEDEPVAIIKVMNSFGLDVYEAELTDAGVNLPEGTKLYTRPNNSELRKAEQDDEPVYLVFSNSTCYDGSWEFANKDEFDKADEDDRYKFYTRRDNSELKKAAEEALVMLKEQEHTGSITALGEQVIRNLEIALGVPSKSFMDHLNDRETK